MLLYQLKLRFNPYIKVSLQFEIDSKNNILLSFPLNFKQKNWRALLRFAKKYH